MKQSKRIFALLMAFVLVLGLTACGEEKGTEPASESAASGEQTSEQASESTSAEEGKLTFDDNSLYLITDEGTIDDKSFNQGSFEGLKKYAEEVGVKANYLRPQDSNDQLYEQAIGQAIDAGAKVVVTPGFYFEKPVSDMQAKNPDVYFIGVDFVPQKATGEKGEDGQPVTADDIGPKTVGLLFREEQSGFLAGYAAVKDGYTKLGFAGGQPVPAVINYGYGFVAGAEKAAKEEGVQVEIKYTYTHSFVAKPEIQTMAASWYKDGTQVVFSCGGGICSSILKAAQEYKGKLIGVDVDQKDMGEEVITSAMKGLNKGVYDTVKSIADGSFEGGKKVILGAKEGGVQLSEDFSRFQKFTEDDYKAIYDVLAKNEDGITDSIPSFDAARDGASGGDPAFFAKDYADVKVEFVK